jgi:hypothetical protein
MSNREKRVEERMRVEREGCESREIDRKGKIGKRCRDAGRMRGIVEGEGEGRVNDRDRVQDAKDACREEEEKQMQKMERNLKKG